MNGAGLSSQDELDGGDFDASGDARLPVLMSVDNLTLRTGAVVTPTAGGTVQLTVSDTFTVEAGARLDTSARGFAGGRSGSNNGGAPVGIGASLPDAGGSHGGTGQRYTGNGPAGEVYDSVYAPQLAGGGGARDEDNAGDGQAGGGVIHVNAGRLVLDGELRARGGGGISGSRDRSGGAGGSVLLDVGIFEGIGFVDASGGASAASFNNERTGSGGGGRVAIYADQLIDFDPVAQVQVRGGARIFGSVQGYAAPGTLYVFRSADSIHGDLIVDSGEDNGADRRGPSTALPVLGAGAVAAFEAAGADAWLSAAEAFPTRFLAAHVRLLDATGEDLGTFSVLELDSQGRALLAGAGVIANAASYQGRYLFDQVELRNGAGLSSQDDLEVGDFDVQAGAARLPVALSTTHLTLRTGSVVTPTAGGRIEATVSGTFTVEAGALLNTSALGFAGGRSGHNNGEAPTGIAFSRPDAGGSHGGTGIRYTGGGPAGEVYDSVYAPQLAGGGGARDEDNAGDGQAGGGVVIVRAGRVVIDGEIRAQGGGGVSGSRDRSGGGGGSILLEAETTLEGIGLIDASGGGSRASFNNERTGSGGGGRIALWANQLLGFDPVAQTRVRGGAITFGSVQGYGAPGTVYVFRTADSTYGDLLIDSGEDGGNDRVGPTTVLPTLGSGTVTAFEVDGADAWLTGDGEFKTRWLNAFVQLLDAGGEDLGIFRVLALDGTSRLRLEGAAFVGGAASFAGKYRFDSVDLRHGAGVATEDELIGMDLEVSPGEAELPVNLVVDNLTLRSGAVARPATGARLTITVNDTLTIEAGARLDVTGRGFAGGESGSNPGDAPAGIAGAQPDNGGSHGGTGIRYTSSAAAGEVYDSVYLPQLSGGGGARDEDNAGDGQPGGGVIDITAGNLVLDGEIRARGEGGTGGVRDRSGGGGGTVLIQTGSFDGSGLIDASGGASRASFNNERTGAGGGGRVAIYADQFLSFDPPAQTRVQGGGRFFGGQTAYAAPGTLYIFDTGTSAYGDLVIDSGEDSGTDRDGPSTELPALGSDAVVLLEADGADAWLSAAQPFQTRWQGVYARLLDSSDADLGVFRVLDVDGAGRALLEGAAGVADVVSYRGVYRFDTLELRNGAGVLTDDELEANTSLVVFDGSAQMPQAFSAGGMTLLSGAVAVPSQGDAVRAQVSGTITIEAGARLDVSARGFRGGRSGSNNGDAPAGVSPARPDAGGSHGGRGVGYTGAGPAGEVYDSVFFPELAGGGGARDEDNSGDGQTGGGVIDLEADQLVLEGELRARGGGGKSGSRDRSGGAGGTVLIRATTLEGAGLIDASGGASAASFNNERTGAGGGGRIALRVDQLVGFDPQIQTDVQGGSRSFGSANAFGGTGTVYVAESTSVAGDLIVDQGGVSGLPIGQTPLPAIGGGTVGVATPDAEDPTAVWIEPQDLGTLFDLGVVGAAVRIGGIDYAVLAQSTDRRQLLLEGAAGVVNVGDAYLGVYRFDSVTVHGGAVLVFDDEPDVGVFDVDPDSTVIDNSP